MCFFDSMKSGLGSKIQPHRPVMMMKFKFILCRYELFEFYIDQKEELESELFVIPSNFECISWRITDPVAEVLFLPSY